MSCALASGPLMSVWLLELLLAALDAWRLPTLAGTSWRTILCTAVVFAASCALSPKLADNREERSFQGDCACWRATLGCEVWFTYSEARVLQRSSNTSAESFCSPSRRHSAGMYFLQTHPHQNSLCSCQCSLGRASKLRLLLVHHPLQPSWQGEDINRGMYSCCSKALCQ